MNRKQLGVTLILICLMIIMLTGEKLFNNDIKKVALTNNNIGNLNRYNALEGSISYSLPDTWDVEEKKYPGNYIVYDNNFVSEEMGILGYVQILNTKKSIEELVNADKEKLKDKSINKYECNEDKINGENITKVFYNEKSNKEKLYLNVIYYKQLSEGQVLKVLFSSSEDKYKEDYNTIYQVILDSFEH
ncbi:hypothetical protein [Clostridium tarantellae]|uniref:Membrane-associated protein n=1 Tax=Clostridium tarantellae TaxID=39493 RepID=A0A6I1MFF0_9CLOT|nr:hypothetical protein [Clostridium tarantellae]MPQ42206.1 hypothetical protein [Clostridium tarantellae]